MGRPLTVLYLLGAIGATFGPPALADHFAADQVPHETAPVQRENRANAGWPIGPFTLIDHRGEKFTQDRLKGLWTFVLFGGTRCAEPCTSALSVLAGLMKRIASTQAVRVTQVLYVSIDPERDTAQRLREYLAPFDAGFVGATGARPTLKLLVEEMGVTDTVAAASDQADAAPVGHSGSVVLIGPDGVIRVEYLPPFDTKRLTAEFLKTRAGG